MTNVNVKQNIFKPLLARCVYDEDAQQWDMGNIEQDLDMYIFNWRQRLDEHYPEGLEVVKCTATFFPDEADSNQAGKPRLDIVVTFSDGTWARYHPGAPVIWSTDNLPTKAMEKRMQYKAKLQVRHRT